MRHCDLEKDLNALLPGQSTASGATRRTALKVALGVGYAASAAPIMAQTAIKTPSDGLTTGEISYEVMGFKVPAFFAAPAGKTNLPVVLVVGLRLGCLNHALLTAEAIRADGLQLAGWVANTIDAGMACRDENIATLSLRLHAPLLGVVPWLEVPDARRISLDLPQAWR